MGIKHSGGNTHLTSGIRITKCENTEEVGQLTDQDAMTMYGMDLSTGELLAEIAGALPEVPQTR